jgi:hypothetical protein
MNRKIVKYTTVTAYDIDFLIADVQDFILDGWQPYGNQYAIPEDETGSEDRFYQPMVKYDD